MALRDSGNKLLSHDTYTYSHSPISFFFFIPLAPPHRPGTRNRPVGLAQGVDSRWKEGGSATRASERAMKRGTSPSRTSFSDEIKTLALVVGKMWPPRAQVGRRGRWVEKPRWKIAVETTAAPKTDVSCVARRKRCVSRTVRDSSSFFFFNVTLERSHYDLRLSSRTIPWKKRKMRGRFEFPTKYYTLFRQSVKFRILSRNK